MPQLLAQIAIDHVYESLDAIGNAAAEGQITFQAYFDSIQTHFAEVDRIEALAKREAAKKAN